MIFLKNLFTPKWSKWSKVGNEKIVKVNHVPIYDPIEKDWVGSYKTEYYLIQVYNRHNRKTGLDEYKEVFIRNASEQEYKIWRDSSLFTK